MQSAVNFIYKTSNHPVISSEPAVKDSLEATDNPLQRMLKLSLPQWNPPMEGYCVAFHRACPHGILQWWAATWHSTGPAPAAAGVQLDIMGSA